MKLRISVPRVPAFKVAIPAVFYNVLAFVIKLGLSIPIGLFALVAAAAGAIVAGHEGVRIMVRAVDDLFDSHIWEYRRFPIVLYSYTGPPPPEEEEF